MTASQGRALRDKIFAGRGLVVPGAANALAARVMEILGFEAVYLSGAGISNTYYALPDLGFIGLSDLVQHPAAVRAAVELPVIVDADTGFGNAVNVHHAVRTLEADGADAIQIEDHVMQKRCGHFEGKEVIPVGEMDGKVRAAVDGRRSDDFLVIARTDACAIEGLDAALDRAAAYAGAGADITFVEAPESPAEIERIASELPSPQVINASVSVVLPAAA